jgi:hypothetical protein
LAHWWFFQPPDYEELVVYADVLELTVRLDALHVHRELFFVPAAEAMHLNCRKNWIWAVLRQISDLASQTHMEHGKYKALLNELMRDLERIPPAGSG